MLGHARRRGEQVEEGRRDGAIRAFRDHAVAFGTVNGGLIALDLATSPHALWALWPIFGWGIGFVSHAASTYHALRAGSDTPPSLAAPSPLTCVSEAEREHPWPDLGER